MDKIKFYKSYLPSIVYGGSDGAVSYFSLMAGAYGAGLSPKIIIAIGVSNLLADGFSMASADYLSEDSKDYNEISQNNKRKYTNLEIKNIEKNSAGITFLSFVMLGALPVLPTLYAYLENPEAKELPLNIFLLSTILTLLSFTFVGYLRAKVLYRNVWRTIAQSILVCSVSAFVAYFVGEYISMLLM